MLGTLVGLSKTLNRLAKQDCLWERHLKYLLHVLFDDSLKWKSSWNVPRSVDWVNDPNTPLTLRDDWRESTALLRWFDETRDGLRARNFVKKSASFLADRELCTYKSLRRNTTRRSARNRKPTYNPYECYDFLFTNTPRLCDYYHLVGKMAHQSARTRSDPLYDWRSTTTDCDKFCSDCFAATYSPPSEFLTLPKIKWFL